MGGCFLGYLEAVSHVLETASDLLAPLGAYKELRQGLRESPSSSALQEATVSWLAATQVQYIYMYMCSMCSHVPSICVAHVPDVCMLCATYTVRPDHNLSVT